MKRYAPFESAVVGIAILGVAVWWLLTQSTEEAFGASYFISAGVSLLVLATDSLRWMHETTAALLGAAALWLVNYVGDTFYPSLRITGLEGSMVLVSWLYRRELAGAPDRLAPALVAQLQAMPHHQRAAPAQGTGRR